MVMIDCPETSVRNYHYSLRNDPEERTSQHYIDTTVRSESRCALIKQLHTLPVLHFNRCLTTEYSETTAHFNGNFDTDNLMYVP
jgi:hypothetical protein